MMTIKKRKAGYAAMVLGATLALLPTPTLADDTVDTNISYHAQECSNWCYAAVAQMVLEVKGVQASQCDIVGRNLDLDCCSPNACIPACNQRSGSLDRFTVLLQ